MARRGSYWPGRVAGYNPTLNTILHNSKTDGETVVKRGTMFCWTLKLKEVLNKQILSASVLKAAVLI